MGTVEDVHTDLRERVQETLVVCLPLTRLRLQASLDDIYPPIKLQHRYTEA